MSREYVKQSDIEKIVDTMKTIDDTGVLFISSQEYKYDIITLRSVIEQRDIEIKGLKYMLDKKGENK